MSKMNTKQNKKRRFNPIVIVALVICALAVIYSVTTAWLTGDPINPIRFTTLEDFDYKMNVYFLQDDGTKIYVIQDSVNVGNDNKYTSSTGTIKLDYQDSSANNYVSKLHVEIKQVGSGVAYTRARVTHEWINSDSGRLQGDSYLPYTVADNFVDKRASDGYIYFKGTMPADGDYTSVINGFNSAAFDASTVSSLNGTTELLINVSVDAVQFNRYQQIWGMDTIPWRS